MILLDTHVWVWWVSLPSRLSPAAGAAIAEARSIAICAISCWEVVMLVQRGRIALDRPVEQWVNGALRADERVQAISLDADIAVRAGGLTAAGFHGDPADRFLYATARSLGATMITRDAAIREFDRATTVW